MKEKERQKAGERKSEKEGERNERGKEGERKMER